MANLRQLRKEARAAVQTAIDNDDRLGRPALVLRRDGNTEVYYVSGGRVRKRIESGHVLRHHRDYAPTSGLPCLG
jgi:3'-phosphoadenosine 5'-phosphosulfate sulfotransferase